MNQHLLVVLPGRVIDELLATAGAEGRGPGDLLVELLTAELPDAFAAAVRERLAASDLPTDAPPQTLASNDDDPRPKPRVAVGESSINADRSLPAGRPELGSAGGVTA
ncbi:MAG: hypothetical protein M0Z69_04830 [Actinomycetota bacterium]|nr:hypothetical protein [Actinomycetota bacterium]